MSSNVPLPARTPIVVHAEDAIKQTRRARRWAATAWLALALPFGVLWHTEAGRGLFNGVLQTLLPRLDTAIGNSILLCCALFGLVVALFLTLVWVHTNSYYSEETDAEVLAKVLLAREALPEADAELKSIEKEGRPLLRAEALEVVYRYSQQLNAHIQARMKAR